MSKPEIILHHYQGSPYAEKVVAALRVRGIPWCSVSTSALLPRPLLEPLAHGYRRIPVMQIGNNIYCDTAVILEELERHYPNPRQGDVVVADMISSWVDKQLFNNVRDQMPWGATKEEQKASPLHAVFGNPAFLADRSQLTGGRPINTDAIRKAQPFLLDQLLANLDSLEKALRGPLARSKSASSVNGQSEGGWIMGTRVPSDADCSVYGIIWWLMTTKRAPEFVTEAAYPGVFTWYNQMNDYMKKYCHATLDQVKMSGEDALQIARSASTSANSGWTKLEDSAHPAEKRKAGEVVSVTPNDYGKVPVVGKILQITRHRVTILPEPLASHPDIKVIMHFPRAGYVIVPVGKASL
ncbi:hypothetical protein BGZ68_008362 [Mortierella alpina]|nr:hypothetical protein BGZ68_008362 [Mortierella alpina]